MRKRLATSTVMLCMLMVIVVSAAMTIPASADTPTPTNTPTPTKTPTPTPTATPLPKMTVQVFTHLYSGTGVTGTIVCTTIEGGYYEISINQTVTFQTTDFNCMGTISTVESSAWDNGHCPGQPWKAQTDVKITVTYTGTVYYNADMETNGSWVTFDSNPIVAPGDIGEGEKTGTIIHRAYAFKCGAFGSTDVMTDYVNIHDTAKPPCDDEYDLEEVVAQGLINATDEDGSQETLQAGEQYKLTVSGGPWTDPSLSRYDTAINLEGGTVWTPLSDFINGNDEVCLQSDPNGTFKIVVVFTAPSTFFGIRVNDITGQFADNTGNMMYRLERVKPHLGPGSCADNYLRGVLLGSGVIPANDADGVHPDLGSKESTDYPHIGTYIEIVTKDGPWYDGGVAPAKYDVSIKNPIADTWELLQQATYATCAVQDGNYWRVFYMLPDDNGIDLRVYDDDFPSNTGEMGYEIYKTTRAAFHPGGCAAQYKIGDLIKTVDAPGASDTGVPVGQLYNGKDVTGGEEIGLYDYFAIETDGFFSDGGIPSAYGAIAISEDRPSKDEFYNLYGFPTEVACYVWIDSFHILAFIKYSTHADDYWVRAQDSADNWLDNKGELTFNFYQATLLSPPDYEPGEMPGPGLCDALYTKGAASHTYTLYGDEDEYTLMPTLTPGKIYGLEISAGPWLNDTVPSYEVEIDDSINEMNMVAFSGAACAQSADGLHLLMYFQALAGREYSLRVYDPEETFSGNDDSIDVIEYDNVVVKHLPPPKCSENYSLTRIGVEDPYIPGNPAGVEIPGVHIGSGNVYAIEISDEFYYYLPLSPDEHLYVADISTDNGGNWEGFNGGWSGATCAIQVNTSSNDYELRYRIYFTAPGSGTLKMRRGIANSIVSLGNLKYILYSAIETQDPNPPPGPIVPPGWQTQCYEAYPRPVSLVKWSSVSLGSITFGTLGTVDFPTLTVPLPAVDDWISYLQWTIRSYFAWCPEHTAALLSIPITMDAYEPFGTINEVDASIESINTMLDGLASTGGEGNDFAPYSVIFGTGGGEDAVEDWEGLFPEQSSTSPWAWSGEGPLPPYVPQNFTFDPYGEIEGSSYGAGGVGNSEYVEYCEDILGAHFTTAVTTAMCVVSDQARAIPLVWIGFQIIIDLGAIAGLISYLKYAWIEPRMSS